MWVTTFDRNVRKIKHVSIPYGGAIVLAGNCLYAGSGCRLEKGFRSYGMHCYVNSPSSLVSPDIDWRYTFADQPFYLELFNGVYNAEDIAKLNVEELKRMLIPLSALSKDNFMKATDVLFCLHKLGLSVDFPLSC